MKRKVKGLMTFFVFSFVITMIIRYISDEITQLKTVPASEETSFATDEELEKAAKDLADIMNSKSAINLKTDDSYPIKEISVEKNKASDIVPYKILNNNIPTFTAEEKITTPFEYYSELDALGRCGMAYANICKELMPSEKRGEIGHIKPSGWHTVKYPNIISDLYLYNRCHLIAFCLAGENDNEKNLITGTRYMNVSGMLPFEEQVLYYVKDTGNHVLYRVTPVFEGNNLVASGVIMEAYSVEDNGRGVCFNVFVYNYQPGITIDYSTGDSKEDIFGKKDNNLSMLLS